MIPFQIFCGTIAVSSQVRMEQICNASPANVWPGMGSLKNVDTSLWIWISSKLWSSLICRYQMSYCAIFHTLRLSLKNYRNLSFIALISKSSSKRILKRWLDFRVEACYTCSKRKRSRCKEQPCLLSVHLFLIQNIASLLLETHLKHRVERKGMTLY